MSKFKRIDLDDSYGGFSGHVQGAWTNQREPRDDLADAAEYAYKMATYTTPKPTCPHCKTGAWRQPLGIEFHSIGTFIQREAGRDRDFQRLLDVSRFTERFNTFVIHHGSEPTWREQLYWLANDAAVSVRFQATPRYNQTALLASPSFDSCLRIMERIHAELMVEGSVYELIQWACGDMVRIYPREKRVTSDPCNVCWFNDPGDFTKWETIEQIHVMQDMGEEEIKIRFAAMRTFIERGFIAMVEQFWHVQDYLQEIGRYDHKMMMKADGSRFAFSFQRPQSYNRNSLGLIHYKMGQFKKYKTTERMYNYNWFLGVPPGRMMMHAGTTKNGINIFLANIHISYSDKTVSLVDIRARENGIYDYFDSSDS